MLSQTMQADETPQINMTPMVDVVLCLLIFFMAATKLYDWDDAQFTVRVPEVETAAPLTKAPDDISVTLVEPGRIRWNNEPDPLDLETLRSRLDEARWRYPAQGVLIRADREIAYQHLADLLATCEMAGIRNVRLPVDPRSLGPARSEASPEPELTNP